MVDIDSYASAAEQVGYQGSGTHVGTESPYNHGRRCLATLVCSTKIETDVREWQASCAVQMLLSTRSPVPVSLAGGEAETRAIDLRFLEAKSDVAVW